MIMLKSFLAFRYWPLLHTHHTATEHAFTTVHNKRLSWRSQTGGLKCDARATTAHCDRRWDRRLMVAQLHQRLRAAGRLPNPVRVSQQYARVGGSIAPLRDDKRIRLYIDTDDVVRYACVFALDL
jgi:hypothetical protein